MLAGTIHGAHMVVERQATGTVCEGVGMFEVESVHVPGKGGA